LTGAAAGELLALLKSLPQTLLVVTHDLTLAAELCERVIILDRGRKVADGPAPKRSPTPLCSNPTAWRDLLTFLPRLARTP